MTETGIGAVVLAVVGLITELLRRMWRRADERKSAAQAAREKHEAAWRNGDIARILDVDGE